MVKLLVADDEQKICRLLESFFAERGYRVLLAHDGPSSLSCIRQERPHLVFLDLHMPGLDGLDILKETRAFDETIKIIVITAVEDAEVIEQVKLLGAADYVIKPFSLEYLQEEVLAKVSTSLYEDLRSANQELKRSLEEMRQVTGFTPAPSSLVTPKTPPHYPPEPVPRGVESAGKILPRRRERGVP